MIRFREKLWLGTLSVSLLPIISGALKLTALFGSSIQTTNSDGASRLALAIIRTNFGQDLMSNIRWFEPPLFVPQLYYRLVIYISSLFEDISIVTNIISVNIIAFSIGAVLIGVLIQRFQGLATSLLSSFFIINAGMPFLVSTTEAVEPISALFIILAFFFSYFPAVSKVKLSLFASAIFFCIATSFRLELIAFLPFLVVPLILKKRVLDLFIYLFIASLFFVFHYLLPVFIDLGPNYFSISKFYPSIRPISLKQLLNSVLWNRGFLGSWGVYLLFLSYFYAFGLLFKRETFFIASLSLFSFFYILGIVIFGKATGGQERYAYFAVIIGQIPLSIGLVQTTKFIANLISPPQLIKKAHNRLYSSALYVIVFLAFSLTTVFKTYELLEVRKSINSKDLQELTCKIIELTNDKDSVFIDILHFKSFSLLIDLYDMRKIPVYNYLSRMYVSPEASNKSNPGYIQRLTKHRGLYLYNLDPSDFWNAYIVFAHGFIEKHHPKYFITLTDTAQNKIEKITKIRSFLMFDSESSEKKPDDPINIDLKFGNKKFTLHLLFKNEQYRIYEASY